MDVSEDVANVSEDVANDLYHNIIYTTDVDKAIVVSH